jgi:manganese-dependent inorganic pyrophosphatase
MGNLKVFGHKNPDLDTVASTVALAHFLKVRDNLDVDMVLLGEMNKEAKFVFNKFNLNIHMPVISSVEDGESVVLVDHNEFSQSANNIENAKIKMVVDHHKIDNFRTAEPLEYIAKPVGSTSTILYGLLKEVNGLENREVNLLLLSAIISDTLLFKSPTTTELDKKVAEQLAAFVEVDLNNYGLELLKAGADLSDLTADELVKIDSKEFDCNRT